MNEWMQQYWTFYHAGVLIFLVAIVIKNGMKILGVSLPEKM